jgi:hypothetical protein
MKHGVSFIEVDNSAIQTAIASKAPKDTVSYLKQQVAFNCVYGFEYDEVSFELLGNLLTNDYGFTPFKYKSVEEGAIYNKDKHPGAWGRVRGRGNVNSTITWLCLDVDKSTITAEEMHLILSKINHHVARTSDKDNPYKFRLLIELATVTVLQENLWKPFLVSIANYLGIKDLDMLGRSQVIYGYKGRQVMSQVSGDKLDPSTHLKIAQMKADELEEKRANSMPKGQADKLLQRPYDVFGFAYDAEPGEGTTKMLAAIHKAKELGASRGYMVDLVHAINNFWDYPMPISRLESTVLTAI